jgi:poly(A) polymerase
MKVSGNWASSAETQAVCALLSRAGHQVLFVGGCVRNDLLGMPVADVDIATDARPERMIALARAEGMRVIPTGFEHGTVTMVSGGVPHEVTTFRRDVETFGRRAVVSFSDDVVTDAARRDFTMNALYAQPDGTVIDPLGTGLPDLAARRLRFVGEPAARIAEDFLRILRFFRFHAWYADPEVGLDPDGLAACAALSGGLEALSRERIGAEMRKLLAAPDPARSVAAMAQSGVLGHVLPGATARALPILLHLEDGVTGPWLRRLAVLGGHDVKDRLRLSTAEARDLSALQVGVEGGEPPSVLGYRHGAALAADMVLARAALLESPPPDDWRAQIARGANAEFPVRAADLMPALSGPALGDRLRALERRWIASGFVLDRAALLAD